jgi:hypothetical protein
MMRKLYLIFALALILFIAIIFIEHVERMDESHLYKNNVQRVYPKAENEILSSEDFGYYDSTVNVLNISNRNNSDIKKYGDIIYFVVRIKNTGTQNLTFYDMKGFEDCYAKFNNSDTYFEELNFDNKNESYQTDNIIEPGETWSFYGHHIVRPGDIRGQSYKAFFNLLVDGYESRMLDLFVPVNATMKNYTWSRISREINGTRYYVCGRDGHSLALLSNKNASNVTYNQLSQFLKRDDAAAIKFENKTDNRRGLDRGNSAEIIYNNAELAGIKAGFIVEQFEDNSIWACNYFDTTDKGRVYVDCSSGDCIQTPPHIGEPCIYTALNGSVQSTSKSALINYVTFP